MPLRRRGPRGSIWARILKIWGQWLRCVLSLIAPASSIALLYQRGGREHVDCHRDGPVSSFRIFGFGGPAPIGGTIFSLQRDFFTRNSRRHVRVNKAHLIFWRDKN